MACNNNSENGMSTPEVIPDMNVVVTSPLNTNILHKDVSNNDGKEFGLTTATCTSAPAHGQQGTTDGQVTPPIVPRHAPQGSKEQAMAPAHAPHGTYGQAMAPTHASSDPTFPTFSTRLPQSGKKSGKKIFFSRSWKSHGILLQVSENKLF